MFVVSPTHDEFYEPRGLIIPRAAKSGRYMCPGVKKKKMRYRVWYRPFLTSAVCGLTPRGTQNSCRNTQLTLAN